MTDHITASPLTWPAGWKREGCKKISRFGKWNKPVTIAAATSFVLDQLRMMGIPDYKVIISTDLKLRLDGLPYSNQRDPDDKGAAVWWKNTKGEQKVIALDKYDRIADNIYSIGKTIEALRGIERWGNGQILNRTFTGFAELPDNSNNWRSILGDATILAEVEKLFRKKRSETHPDNGGDPEAFQKVMKAWEEAKAEFA